MNYGMRFTHYELTLGMTYLIKIGPKKAHRVELVRPTKKGFNFRDNTTGKLLLRKHLYATGMSKKPIPADQFTFSFSIPYYKDNRIVVKLAPKGYLKVNDGEYKEKT